MIELEEPLPLDKLIKLGIEHPSSQLHSSHLPVDQMVDIYTKRLIENASALLDLFSIKINVETRTLEGLSLLHPDFKPFPHELPILVLRLASEVDYTLEMESIAQVSVELSHYYAKLIDTWATISEVQGREDEQTKAVTTEIKESLE